jgi:hypothetical protein
MQLADLERALKAELETGRLGIPVALRIHATLSTTTPGIWGSLGCFGPLLALMGEIHSGEVHAKQHPSGKECAVLWTADSGKTVFLTLATSAKSKQTLHLLLIGNHGTTQLKGGDAWSDSLPEKPKPLWEQEIQESLRKGTSIRIEVS